MKPIKIILPIEDRESLEGLLFEMIPKAKEKIKSEFPEDVEIWKNRLNVIDSIINQIYSKNNDKQRQTEYIRKVR